MKKMTSLILVLALVFALGGCLSNPEEYISGTSFDIPEYQPQTYTEYYNKNYGITIEYPEKFERIGNFDLDGFISFEKDDVSIKVYVIDTDAKEIFTAEEYSDKILKFQKTTESMNITYGKCSGYKTVIHKDGSITIEFVVKGVDGFYRFSYTCLEENFQKNKEQFNEVMSSIRIDDGVYKKLVRMSARYDVLLEYVISMQYITDANYANHCLNSFELSKEEFHRQEAITTYNTIKEQIATVVNHERSESEGYDEYWEKVKTSGEEMLKVCDSAIEAIQNGNNQEAQRIARTAFSYDLSQNASKFLATINAEIAEY